MLTFPCFQSTLTLCLPVSIPALSSVWKASSSKSKWIPVTGLPGMAIVGLPDAAVQESREPRPGGHQECRAVLPAQARGGQPGAGLRAQGRPGLRPAHRPGRADLHRQLAPEQRGRHAGGGRTLAGWQRAPCRAACCRWQPWPASRASSASSCPQADAAEAALIPDLEVIPVAIAGGAVRPPGRARQPIPPQPPITAGRPARQRADRFPRDQGPGARQARPGSGRGRRAQRLDDRAARRRQDPAGARPARHPAAHDHRRSPGCDPHLFGGRPAARRTCR